MELAIAIASAVTILIILIARKPLKRWSKKVRRRRGGVYLWRVRHHAKPMQRVNGYVGETVSFHHRAKQHLAVTRFDVKTGVESKTGALKVPKQSWSDLDPTCHPVIRLPWWLCWKWILKPLETLVILCTWPVYNDKKNRWNPRQIPIHAAKAMRAARDRGGFGVRAQATAGRLARLTLQVAGTVLVFVGIFGWMATR